MPPPAPNAAPAERTRILLAVPTARYIEAETFKSIYELEVPPGVELTFQYFHGYNVDQVRNLIAHWAVKFDHLFAVDSDIVLPADALRRLFAHGVDIVSGVYIQRRPEAEITEIYRRNALGGMTMVPFRELLPAGLKPIDACGFGCVLVRSEVLRRVGYPQFKYHAAIDHLHAVSEDIDFCIKAERVGAKLYVDSSVVCGHVGTTVFRPRT